MTALLDGPEVVFLSSLLPFAAATSLLFGPVGIISIRVRVVRKLVIAAGTGDNLILFECTRVSGEAFGGGRRWDVGRHIVGGAPITSSIVAEGGHGVVEVGAIGAKRVHVGIHVVLVVVIVVIVIVVVVEGEERMKVGSKARQ